MATTKFLTFAFNITQLWLQVVRGRQDNENHRNSNLRFLPLLGSCPGGRWRLQLGLFFFHLGLRVAAAARELLQIGGCLAVVVLALWMVPAKPAATIHFRLPPHSKHSPFPPVLISPANC